MNDKPCRERVFPSKMAASFENCYSRYAHWLKHLLERLGREPALEIWAEACTGAEDELLAEILATGWDAVADEPVDVQARIEERLRTLYGSPVQGVTVEGATELVEKVRPIKQIRQRFSGLHVVKTVTAYQFLHLFRKGLAMLAEALLNQYGKQGEFIAYDIKLAWARANSAEMQAEEFLKLFQAPLNPGTFQGAGLEYNLLRASESEVVLHIAECELARYYLEHHPRVGYLMACSMDEAEYRAVSDRIRMQRTSTLMEGGKLCDFRIYVIGEAEKI